MPNRELDKVDDNDLRKLHAEVNQIASQRFSLTTASVVAFATVCGWACSAIKDKTLAPNFICTVAILLLLIFWGLYLYFMLLLSKLKLLTVYIAVKYQSPWEVDWQRYRESYKYWGYTNAGTFIFQFLGVLSILFLGGLWLVGRGEQPAFPYRFLWPIGVLFLYELFIIIFTKQRDAIFKEQSLAANWAAVIKLNSSPKDGADGNSPHA
jgi:hypothetical protein